jgi:hypothetical protein
MRLATISWPEAVAQLAGERAKAETCVALMKRYGDDAQIARAQLTYTNAKADVVVAGTMSTKQADSPECDLVPQETAHCSRAASRAGLGRALRVNSRRRGASQGGL